MAGRRYPYPKANRSDAARERVQAAVVGARLVRPDDGGGDFRVESPSGRVLGRGRSVGSAWIDADTMLPQTTGNAALPEMHEG